LTSRAALRLAPALCLTLTLAACASTGGAAKQNFQPVNEAVSREALDAWDHIRARVSELPSSRLLYDAKIGKGSVPAVPGTLAVTYTDGQIRRASLTGPFGSRIAEFAGGSLTGEDRQAFVVDPEALRSVLAGTWPGTPNAVEGCDGQACLLVWDGTPRVSAVVDRIAQETRSLSLEGQGGRLVATYSGAATPWPERIGITEERSERTLALKLVAVERQGTVPGSGR